MYRKISRDLKLCAIKMYELDILPLRMIFECVGFSLSTFYRILDLWITTGDVVAHNFGLPGRRRLLHFDDVDYLLRLIRHRSDWFLDELLDLLKTNRFISVHYVTIHRELCRAGASLKKLKKIATERKENVRNDYIERMGQYDADELGFIDETSKNDKTPARSRGRAKKGHRAVMKQKFVRGRRLTATALLTSDGIAASRVIEGSMTKALYLDFLENDVMPLCSAYPGLLSVLVMDNARIHHGEEILALADRFGVRIEYLPAYSPDLNPIEEAFSKIKVFIRRNNDIFLASEVNGQIFDMYEALEVITPIDAMGYYIHAGYF